MSKCARAYNTLCSSAICLILILVNGLSYTLFLPSVYAITFVEGHITQDITWEFQKSPYRIISDVILDSGVKLTIEPGVKVEFADDSSLIVNGSLYAVGLESNRIYFSSSRTDASSGAWETIKFNGETTDTFIMKYCSVSFATSGVTIMSLGISIIERSNFINNVQGIEINGDLNVIINGNTFQSNSAGIISKSGVSGAKIFDNNIQQNYIGIDLWQTVYNITLLNNFISENEKGIDIGDWDIVYNITIKDNTINSNKYIGINIESKGHQTQSNYVIWKPEIFDILLSGNTVTSNGLQGILLLSHKTIYGIRVIGNTICNNGVQGSNEGVAMLAGRRNVDGYIHDIEFVKNTIMSNGGDGIIIFCSTGWYGNKAYNINIMNNVISKNLEHGIHIFANHYEDISFDLKVFNNTLNTNNIGFYVPGGTKANLTYNSIYNNQVGVQWENSLENMAYMNDIYDNSKGMLVFGRATVNAENNYWGDSTGPYHESINPEGKGNSVNGDMLNLDFIPFSSSSYGTIEEPEELNLEILLDPTTVNSGEEVVIHIHVTDGTDVVDNVFIELVSMPIGSFSPPSGYTDSNGDLSSTFIAPSVSEVTIGNIHATATKRGYIKDEEGMELKILPSAPDPKPEPEPEPEQESRPEPSVWDKIPGFQYETIILGLTAGAFVLWLLQRKR